MRTTRLALLMLTFVTAPEAVDDSPFQFSKSIERTFASAGTVRLELSAGDYDIRGGSDSHIRVTWRTRTADQMGNATVRAEVRGREAKIETAGPRNAFRVEIELPRRSDLHLRMSAGDLTIANIAGNKDVRLRAGNINIEVADPAEYGHVKASVTAGDLSARPFGFTTGGLFRSFEHEGSGRFDLRARLWAGDLRLLPPPSAR